MIAAVKIATAHINRILTRRLVSPKIEKYANGIAMHIIAAT